MQDKEARISVQVATNDKPLPPAHKLRAWAKCALDAGDVDAELNIRIVGYEEGRDLNARWRHHSVPTNVLAFPIDRNRATSNLLGDIVICAPIAIAEANDLGADPDPHWAHLIIHGTLHLLGYDHEHDEDAKQMEELERTLLRELGYADPYL